MCAGVLSFDSCCSVGAGGFYSVVCCAGGGGLLESLFEAGFFLGQASLSHGGWFRCSRYGCFCCFLIYILRLHLLLILGLAPIFLCDS